MWWWRWRQRDKGSDKGVGGKYVGKGGDKSRRGACGDNDGVGKGGDKSGGDDDTGELGEGGRYQRMSDWGWFVVATEGGVEGATRMEVEVGWEAERSSNNNNGDSSSSNFQRLEQQQQQ